MTTPNNSNRKNDAFADIAASGMRGAVGEGLIEPQPPSQPHRILTLAAGSREGAFEPMRRLSTSAELAEELERQRTRYAPYMERHAPELPSRRLRQELEAFDWRIGTGADEGDFAGVLAGRGAWERVSIPHYGEPIGRAFTLYRTSFAVTEQMLAIGRIYLVFKGVDYRTHVYVNSHMVGSHEGFFAPFEFDVTTSVHPGDNVLVVKVDNDFICGDPQSGDKLYAATGLGFDTPGTGWHHCPPGMGIYQEVAVEARPAVHIGAMFVRPLRDLESAEAWVEVENRLPEAVDVKLRLSVYGRNLAETVFAGLEYAPSTGIEVGMGDSFTEANLKREGQLDATVTLQADRGRSRFVVPLSLPGARRWEPEQPWLYELQVELLSGNTDTEGTAGSVVDTASVVFGMRTFEIDTAHAPRGALRLNGRQIRLRGANTMGHEQQCVYKRDWAQLRDDILLAKIANMNFLRLTQRPVQPEVYAYCDMLGLMTQTDLPLFGVLSRSQFVEAIRQAEEMERLVRSHPCNIMVTYINEPFPNARNKPHRHLTRAELTAFFQAADLAVRLNNPDRVIKHVDGDYDPPSETLPDNHCYPYWYNGHGIDVGRLHRGYWLPVKPDWYYGCGEFGAEGLDAVELMRRRYPPEWLPQQDAEADWSPSAICQAQTGRFHYFFFDTPDTVAGWSEASRRYQAWATRMMTEAFRRDTRMTSFAIHLFIDAFPAGWMKAIMDVERQPKPAYFAYRDALEPLMTSLRTDRFAYYGGEELQLEAWICHDRHDAPAGTELRAMLLAGERLLATCRWAAAIPACSATIQGELRFAAPEVTGRETLTVRLALCDADGHTLHDTSLDVEVFPRRAQCHAELPEQRAKMPETGDEPSERPLGMSDPGIGLRRSEADQADGDVGVPQPSLTESGHAGGLTRRSLDPSVVVLGSEEGPARRLARELGLPSMVLDASEGAGVSPSALHAADATAAMRPDLVLADDAAQLAACERELLMWAEAGTRIVALELAPGRYDVLGEQIEVKSSGMLPLHFVSRQTGHRLVSGFRPDDFRLWYSPEAGMIAPLLHHTYTAAGMTPVLLSGNTDASGEWGPALAAAEKTIGRGAFAICQVTLAGRCDANPVAAEFADRLLGLPGLA